MTAQEDAQRLHRRLHNLARNPEWPLLVRFELRSQSWYRRLGSRAAPLLNALGLNLFHYRRHQWSARLKHGSGSLDSRMLVIWAEGAGRECVREHCVGFQRFLAGRMDWTPVLVTDVADFVFYSRPGWLVEYLPDVTGAGVSYRDRKRRYLAWRYRDAITVPFSAGLASETELEALLLMDGI